MTEDIDKLIKLKNSIIRDTVKLTFCCLFVIIGLLIVSREFFIGKTVYYSGEDKLALNQVLNKKAMPVIHLVTQEIKPDYSLIIGGSLLILLCLIYGYALYKKLKKVPNKISSTDG